MTKKIQIYLKYIFDQVKNDNLLMLSYHKVE